MSRIYIIAIRFTWRRQFQEPPRDVRPGHHRPNVCDGDGGPNSCDWEPASRRGKPRRIPQEKHSLRADSGRKDAIFRGRNVCDRDPSSQENPQLALQSRLTASASIERIGTASASHKVQPRSTRVLRTVCKRRLSCVRHSPQFDPPAARRRARHTARTLPPTAIRALDEVPKREFRKALQIPRRDALHIALP